jgi:hypothetical protein
MIGRIERVQLREVWKHEALDFTKWLLENIDVLNDIIDFNLSNAEREQSAGNFNVDLIAEDDSGNPVIIENQLGKSDHDHLGKLITYLVAVGARTAIWIISDPRPEHISAITWLNESSSANFYLIKLEAIKIGESAPAPLLTLIVGPTEEGRDIGTTKKEIAERYLIRQRFWTELLNFAKLKTKLHANITPGQYSWIGTGAGKYGLSFNYAIRKNEAQVELYIDRGKDKDEENKQIFDNLIKNKAEIESEFAESLDWQRLDNRRASRIRKQIMIGGYRDEDKWLEINEQMVDSMIRLEKALRPYIANLTI